MTRKAVAYVVGDQKLFSIRVLGNRTLDIVISNRDEPASEQVIRVLCEPNERFDAPKIAGLGFVGDHHMLAAIHFRLMVWNTNTGQLEFSTPEHNPDRLASSYRAMELHRDECVAVTEDGRLDHWKWTGQELIKVRPSLELKTTEAERLAWHPQGDCVIVGTQSGSIQAIDLKAGRTVFVDRSIHNSEICGAIWCNANV